MVPNVSTLRKALLWNLYIFRKFEPQFGTEFGNILIPCLVLRFANIRKNYARLMQSFRLLKQHAGFAPCLPPTISERTDFQIILRPFVLAFKIPPITVQFSYSSSPTRFLPCQSVQSVLIELYVMVDSDS
jgi:hypothetical protein